MPLKNNLPDKCQKCAKSLASAICRGCRFCQNLKFQETILCDLNRQSQQSVDFKCQSFQPILKLVGTANEKPRASSTTCQRPLPKNQIQKVLDSDIVRYQHALAVQKLNRDPDGVFVELKYHFAWNVIHRKPVFVQPENMFGIVSDIFENCSHSVGGFVWLLWLASDHVHLYVESDGKNPVDTIARNFKRLSSESLFLQYPGIVKSLEKVLWDNAYFVEPIS